MKFKVLLSIPAIFIAVTVFIASSFEQVPFFSETIIGWDKLIHMSVFFLFSISLQMAIAANRNQWSNKKIGFISSLLALIYALSDEIHQYFVPGRVCDFWDFAADAIGIFISLFFVNFISRKVKSKIKQLEK